MIHDFVVESNKIEGITREPTVMEVAETERFVNLARLTVADVVDLVEVYQPGAKPRFVAGMNVRVGSHTPPKGGPEIQLLMMRLLIEVNGAYMDAYEAHQAYEELHPFVDGNGRSGRAIWLWQMLHSGPRNEDMAVKLGFLHSFYYQALSHGR